MRRRDFVIVLLGSTLLATREGRTQQQRLLGFLSAGSADAYVPFIDAFRSALSDAGYTEGRNLAIEFRWAEGHYDRLSELTADLVRSQVDVIVASGGSEDAAPDALAGHLGEEAFHGIEPGPGGRGEVEDSARVAGEPGFDLGMLVGGVIGEDGVDHFAGRDGALDGVEKADEFLVGMALHAAPVHDAVERVEGGKQSGGAMPLVVVRHRSAFTGLERQTRLGTIKRLDLRFLIDR